MFKRFYFLTVFFAFYTVVTAQSDAYRIEGELTGYDQDSIFLGYYFADKQYLIDTSIVENGKFVFSREDSLNRGVYLIVMPPDNRFFQIVINEPFPKLKMMASHQELEQTIAFEGSPDNILFYENLRYISALRKTADSLTQKKDEAASELDKAELQKQLEELNDVVVKYQKDLVNNNPETLTGILVKSGFRINLPSYEGTPEEIQLKQYLYYKKHYFDHIDLGDERMMRCPQHAMYDRVNYYLEKLTPKQPDSIILALDYLLEEMEPAENACRTFLIKFLNDFASSKIVGMDAVYVHLVEKYYSQGKAPWVDETQLAKIIGNARDAKPTLIGKIAPDFTVQMRDSSDIKLSDINSPYTVLIFWAHDCAHCKETMPEFTKFQEDYREKGVTVFSVCTKVLADEPPCWNFVDEKGIGALINASDKTGGKSYVRTLYNVRRTPKLFVMDADKKILTKELNMEQLREYFDTMVGPLEDIEK